MKEYKCRKCEYRFCSENGIPYCPSCDCESLEEVIEKFDSGVREKMESHHILPRFMDNPNGNGEQFIITKRQHDILHGKIMNWIWEEITDDLKVKIEKIVVSKSKKFIGVNQ